MKKIMIICCLLVASLSAHAQFEQGKWIVNPSITGLDLSHSKGSDTTFGIEAQGGNFLMDNVALLVTLGAQWQDSYDSYALGVGGRYYFDKCGVYAGAGLKMNHVSLSNSLGGGSDTNYLFNAEVGYAFFITRTVTIEPAVYYDLNLDGFKYDKFGLKVGFGIYF